MNFQSLFENYTPKPIHLKGEAAVLLLLSADEDGYRVVFERRSAKVSQPGDTCLIGGRLDKGETPKEAMFREAKEEASLYPEMFHLWGELDYLITLSGYMVHVFLGELCNPGLSQLRPNDEVEEFFAVPLDYFLENAPNIFKDKIRFERSENFPYQDIAGGTSYPFWIGENETYFYYYKHRVIWGMTASIMRHFAQRIREVNKEQ